MNQLYFYRSLNPWLQAEMEKHIDPKLLQSEHDKKEFEKWANKISK